MTKRAVSKTEVLLILIGAIYLAGSVANADDAALQGVFANPAQTDETIKPAIEVAVKDFNFISRPIARSRLKKANTVIKRVEVGRAGKAVTITLGTGNPTVTEPGAAPVKWKRNDGEVFDVSTEWQGATLVQSFVAEDGKRVNRYTLSPDGATLTMQVTISSEQLKAPVQYQLSFKREGTKNP
jgi:hypothetical protein